jgi:hypothetical protein
MLLGGRFFFGRSPPTPPPPVALYEYIPLCLLTQGRGGGRGVGELVRRFEER